MEKSNKKKYMKVSNTYIIIAAAALLTLIGCTKKQIDQTPGTEIMLTATEAGTTKALLEADSFMNEGNQIKVYDYYTPATGAATYYIPGATAQSGGSTASGTVWPFTGDTRYEWTSDGVHKFFGWLEKDNNNGTGITASGDGGFFGTEFGFSTTEHILTIPETTLSQDGPQFDFMYSNIEPREPATEGFDPVSLEFNHLFTAFKITAANNSSNDVWLKGVRINGLKNTRGASIDYSGTEPVVSYTTPTGQQDFVYNVSDEGMLMTKGQLYNISPEDFTIMWPHTRDDFSDAEVIVDYSYKEPSAATPIDGNTTIQLKDLFAWNGGQKNNLGLMFKDKEISLTCKVEPWTVVEETIDFTDQITVSNPLTWVPNSVESVNYKTGDVVLYTDSYSVAICNFRLDTPAGATWTASLIPVEGYSDAFKILDNTKYGAVGVDSEVHIQVTNMAPIAPRHVVLLRITVQTADGRTIVADMMPNQTDESITEYKLIQNLING